MSGYYDDCFDHITDPVQRNSVRQQWLQMVDGGLSIADVRMLLDKYPDFRFVIGRWISTKPESLGLIELMSEQNKREEAGRWYTDKPY